MSTALEEPLVADGGVQVKKAPGAEEEVAAQASMSGSTFNLINNVIGAGMLSLPWALKEATLVPGCILLLVVCVLSGYSQLLLARCCELSGSYVYKDMGKKALGKTGGIVVQGVMLCYTLGTCISYIVLIGDFTTRCFAFFAPHSAVLNNRDVILVLIGATVLLPLAMLKDLSALRYTSFAAIIFILYTAATTLQHELAFGKVDSSVVVASYSGNFWIAAPIMSVAFTSHYNAPRYYQELSQRSMRRYGLVVIGSLLVCAVVYYVTALSGYLNFGAATDGDILNSYAISDVSATAARLALTGTIVFSYPLAFHSLRSSVHAICFPSVKPTVTRLRLYSLVLVPATVAIGILLKKVEVVLAYNGATFGSIVTYICPGLMYLRLSKRRERLHTAMAALLVLFGSAVFVLGILKTSASVAAQHSSHAAHHAS